MIDNKKSFFMNTLALYLMNITRLIFPLLTLPYLTRVLTTDAYGVVTYIKSFVVYVQLILDFGFLLSATKDIVYVKDNKNEVGRILGDTIAEKGILGIIATIIFSVAVFNIPILKQYTLFSYMYLVSALLTIFIFDFMYRGLEKMHLVAIPFIVAKTITTIMTFRVVHNDSDLLFIPLLEVISSLVSVSFSFFFVRQLNIKVSFSGFKKWYDNLRDSCIYFISNFATTVFGALTTVIAGFYLSLTDIACWGLCMQLLSATKALYNPITNSLYPHMIREKDLYLVKKINFFMFFPILIGCFMVIFYAESIMTIIGGKSYIIAGNTLRLLLPAFGCSFYSMIYGWPVLGAIGKVKETTTTTVIASIIQLIGLGMLIILRKISLTGIAVCCSLSEISLFIVRYVIFIKNRKLFVNNIEWKRCSNSHLRFWNKIKSN